MEQAEDFAPGRIGDGAKRQAKLIGCGLHAGSPIIKHQGARAGNKNPAVPVVTAAIGNSLD
jgi:hypothetical protein